MNDEPRVWIRKRATKRGHSYHLRWICPHNHSWKSRKAGTDRKYAERQAAVLEQELLDGTHRNIRRIGWVDFVAEHVRSKSGKWNRRKLQQVLTEFGKVQSLTDLRRITFADVEIYVDYLRNIKNAPATIHGKLGCLCDAFKLAVRRGYMTKSPMDGWRWEKLKRNELRILTADEEVALLDSAEKLYGFQMVMFIRFVLETWARLSETTGLSWNDVDFDGSCVMFRDTKSNEDRYVPFAEGSNLPADLQRLKVQTLQSGGPFMEYASISVLSRKWAKILEDAGIPYITRHDLRRTGITRALLANMPPVAVQKMAGHANISTTMKFYVQVSRNELRDAVSKCFQQAAG